MLSSVKSLLKYRLPKIIKFLFVLLMCLLIIISPCILRPVKVEAAMTGTAIVGGAVVVASILASVGICIWASDADNRKAAASACESIYQDCKSAVDDVITGAAIAGAGIASVTVPTKTIESVFNDAVQVIPQGLIKFKTTDEMLKEFQMDTYSKNIIFSDVNKPNFKWSDISKFSSVQFLGRVKMPLYKDLKVDDLLNIPFENTNGTTLGFTFHWTYSDSFIYATTSEIWVNGHHAADIRHVYPSTYPSYGNYLYLLKVNLISDSYYILCVPATENSLPVWNCGWSDVISAERPIPVPAQDVFSPSRDKWIADGTSAMNTPIDKVVNRVKEKVGDKDGNIPMTVPRGKTIDDDTVRQRQADVLGKDISDTQDRNKDVATNKTAEVPDTKTDDNTKASDNDDTLPPALPTSENPKKMKIPANNLSNKFPFSIPFDLYHAIKILAAPPEAPKFTVHFGKASYVMDMSIFDPVATVARWGLSLLFLLGLIVLTDRVIKH